MQPVILAGGNGTRLKPLSTPQRPKPFLALHPSGQSFFQETLRRIAALPAAPVILCNRRHRALAQTQLREIRVHSYTLILEPEPRDTAAAIAIAALHNPVALLLILPSDHVIGETARFLDTVRQAETLARRGYLITFGIAPTRPETGYGYIRRGKPIAGTPGFAVAHFTEKPDVQTATRYLVSGEYWWNSGIFLFPAKLLLAELERYQPALLTACGEAWESVRRAGEVIYPEKSAFARAPRLPIDRALLEHTAKAACLPLACSWHDIGTPEALEAACGFHKSLPIQ